MILKSNLTLEEQKTLEQQPEHQLPGFTHHLRRSAKLIHGTYKPIYLSTWNLNKLKDIKIKECNHLSILETSQGTYTIHAITGPYKHTTLVDIDHLPTIQEINDILRTKCLK